MTQLSFENSVAVPESVLVRVVGGEAVLLNLDSGRYFGLDAVGTRMWELATTTPSIEAAYEALRAEYEVSAEALRRDLDALLSELVEEGLLALKPRQAEGSRNG